MKTLTPAMKRALINALDSNKHMLFGVHPRTLGALDARDLITWWGALNMPTLNAAGIALAESLTGKAAPVSLIEQAEIAAGAHFANATSEDVARHDGQGQTYKASEAALRAAIVAAYPACNVERVVGVWIECNESIAYCVDVAQREAAEQAAYEIQSQLEDVAYLVGKDGSEGDRAMFRTIHADNAEALAMLRAGELDAANLAQGGWVTPVGTPSPADVTRMILAGDDAGLQTAADAVIAAITERQFCRVAPHHSCTPAVTLTFRNGAGRLHWCAEHAADAEAYRADSDQADAPHGWESTATPTVSGFTPITLPADAMEVCEAAQSAGLVITEPGYVDCRVIYIRKPDSHMGRTVVTVVAYRSGDLSFHDGTDAGLTRDAALTLVRSFDPATRVHVGTFREACSAHGCPGCPVPAPVADHTIPMVPADAREASYGITHKSQYVYRTSKSGYPTRIVRWSNTGRLNGRNGQPVRFGEVGPIDGGDGQYLDPRNRATDNPVTILVSTEDITIDAYGTGTGTVGSGQVYAPRGEILRPGETVTLTYGDDTSGPYPVRFTGNGHGYIEI